MVLKRDTDKLWTEHMNIDLLMEIERKTAVNLLRENLNFYST